ncbi:hypothetical protein [Vacuolonema iberomarrocanum]
MVMGTAARSLFRDNKDPLPTLASASYFIGLRPRDEDTMPL